MNSEAKAFFDTLPKWLREDILQSGVSFETRNDLEQIAKTFTGKAETGKNE